MNRPAPAIALRLTMSRRFALRALIATVALAVVWAPVSAVYVAALKPVVLWGAAALGVAVNAGPGGMGPWLLPAFAVFLAAEAPVRRRLAFSAGLLAAAFVADASLLLAGAALGAGRSAGDFAYQSVQAALLFASVIVFAGPPKAR